MTRKAIKEMEKRFSKISPEERHEIVNRAIGNLVESNILENKKTTILPTKEKYLWDLFKELEEITSRQIRNSSEYQKVNEAAWEVFGLWHEEFFKQYRRKK